MSFRITLKKESFKFSCSHFTIFSETKAERLHGHNYYVAVTVEFDEIDPKLGLAFDFNELKPKIKDLCDQLDERILIPTKSPYLKIKDTNDEIEIRFHNKRYIFPNSDSLKMEITNITTEELARWFFSNLNSSVKKLGIKKMFVNVKETQGQSSQYFDKVT